MVITMVNITDMERRIVKLSKMLLILVLFLTTGCRQEKTKKKDISDTSDIQETVQGTLYIGDGEYNYYGNIKTYLIIGTDSRSKSKKYKASMADFLLLAVVDSSAKTFGLLQIDRNTITEVKLIDDDGSGEATSDEQICCANWYGGTPQISARNTMDAVSEMLGGININRYYSLNMGQIGDINHAVGGVTVEIEDDLTNVDPDFKKGATVTLTDKQAEEFVRARMGVTKEKNTARMKRQRTFMKALGEKVKEDTSLIETLPEELEDKVTTNMVADDFGELKEAYSNYKDLGTLTIKGKTKLGDALEDGEVHEEFYMDETSLIDVMTKLCHLKKSNDS